MVLEVEGQFTERAPAAYDAVNDIFKQGTLYLAAADRARGVRYTNNNLAGFTQTTNTPGAFLLVPVGRTLFITDFSACVADVVGKQVVCEVLADGDSIAPGIVTPLNGGSAGRSYVTPLIVPGGQTVSFQFNPLGGPAAFFSSRFDGILL